MKVRKISGLLLIVLISFYFTGCFDVNGEFRNIRNHLLSGFKDGYEKDQEFALGTVSLSMVKHVMEISEKGNKDKELIENISELQIGVYKKKNISEGPDFEHFSKICREMERGGWIRMVKSFEGKEISAVFLKLNNKEQLTKMFVISMDRDELVLTQINGKLDRLFEIALRQKGLNVSSIKN